MKKVSITAARAFIVALFAFWCQTLFAQTFDVDGITYRVILLEENECEVLDQGGDIAGSVIIPETVTYEGQVYSVTSIGRDAFSYCSGLTSISIPDNVTSIGWGAFLDCSGLTSISIPDNVTSIGEHAFYGCSGLTSISIPEGVTSIEGGNFCVLFRPEEYQYA